MADLSLVDEDGLGVVVDKVLGQFRILSDGHLRHFPYRHGVLLVGWQALPNVTTQRYAKREGSGRVEVYSWQSLAFSRTSLPTTLTRILLHYMA